MQRKMINWISAPMFMAPRTKSVISCHCSIYGAEPLPVSLYFLLQHSCTESQRQLLGMEGGCCFRMVSTTQYKRDSRLYLTQNIPVLVWAGFKIQMCISSLWSIFCLPPNGMRLCADPNIPKNLVLFKCQNQTQLWALQLRPSSKRWLLTLAYLFRLCWQPRQRSKGLVLLLIWIQHM